MFLLITYNQIFIECFLLTNTDVIKSHVCLRSQQQRPQFCRNQRKAINTIENVSRHVTFLGGRAGMRVQNTEESKLYMSLYIQRRCHYPTVFCIYGPSELSKRM